VKFSLFTLYSGSTPREAVPTYASAPSLNGSAPLFTASSSLVGSSLLDLFWAFDLRGSVVPAFLNERPDALHEFLSHPQDAGGVLSGDMDELLVVRLLPGVEDTVKQIDWGLRTWK